MCDKTKCAICSNGCSYLFSNSSCILEDGHHCQYFYPANEYQLISRFYDMQVLGKNYKPFINDLSMIHTTIRDNYNKEIPYISFRSRGEAFVYYDTFLPYINNSNIHIVIEAKLADYGCPKSKKRTLKGDFLICDKNNKPYMLIEIQGIQHQKDLDVIQRDNIKFNWCDNNNIELCLIPYINGELSWNFYYDIFQPKFDRLCEKLNV